jgi:hypothetical protein
MNKWQKLFTSRRFWAALGTIISLVLADIAGLELEPATIAAAVGVVVTWIYSQTHRPTPGPLPLPPPDHLEPDR